MESFLGTRNTVEAIEEELGLITPAFNILFIIFPMTFFCSYEYLYGLIFEGLTLGQRAFHDPNSLKEVMILALGITQQIL